MWGCIFASLALCVVVHAQTPDLVIPTDPRCSVPQTRIRDGFGYVPDNARCDAWIRCSFDIEGVKSERQLCGCGRFWNDDLMTCVPALDQICSIDPCTANSGGSYAYVDNCRSYWSCDGPRTARGMCCDEGFRYDQGQQGCVRDPTCIDWCNCYETTTEDPQPCQFLPNAADAATYIVRIDGRRYVMPCAPGTHYNASECKCSDRVEIPQPVCAPDFDVQCNVSPVSDVANRAYIENLNTNIDLTAGACLFNGDNSQLLVPRYANMDWRYEWAMRVAFDDQGHVNTNAPLYSNSACANASPSIVLKLTRPGGTPTVEATINANSPASISVPYAPSQRNDVYMWYDGTKFNLCVKSAGGTTQSDSADITGLTKRVHCTVRYGQDEDGNNFNGAILETQVHIYCVPNNFCGS